MNIEHELTKLNNEIAAHPLDFEPLVERGNLYAEAERFEEAIGDYSAALALSPECALVWDNRGVARLYLLDYYAALADFTQAVSYDPVYFYSYANRAYVYALLEKPNWALEDARRALALCPELAPAHTVIGQALLQLGQLEEAVTALTQALALDPGCVQAPFYRAMVWLRLKRPQEARADLQLYLSRSDDQQNSTARQAQAHEWLARLEQSPSL